ncbi:MAG: ABC transporter ATP-binding protein, partial [Burkholderiales bacterium]
ARAKLDDLARRFGLAVEASAKVSTLSVGEKQRVEILKALYRGARILILDEPTAVLTPQEAESLFHTLRQLVAQGLAVIFISHKLGEVLAVSDHVAVLRGGKLVAQCPAKDVTKEDLATLMVGRQVEMPRRDERPHAGPVRLLVKNAFTERAQGRSGLQDLSLVVRSGEIVAVAGVAGNGQDILAGVLSGLIPLERGTVAVEDQPLPSNPRAWIQANVGRVPEDRQGVGSIGDMSVWENAILERYGEKRFSRAGMISRPAAHAHAQSLVGHYDVRISHIDAPMRSLSGGNIQKLLLGRVLSEKPRLLVVNQPTWGLDIGAVAFIHAQLLEARKEGAAIVLISEDLDEIFALADRIAVMHAGRLSEARLTAQWTMSGIGLAMAGAA